MGRSTRSSGVQRAAVWCKAVPAGVESRPGASFLNVSRKRRVLPLQRQRVSRKGNSGGTAVYSNRPESKTWGDFSIAPNRPCLKNRGAPKGKGFFRRTRRFFAGILGVFQEKATMYRREKTCHGACESFLSMAALKRSVYYEQRTA